MRAASDPFAELINGLYDAVLICSLDGTIVNVNERAQQFLESDAQALIGTPAADIFAGFDDDTIERILRHLESRRFTVLDAVCIRRDKTTFSSETAVSRLQLSQAGELLFTIRNVDRRRRVQTVRRTEHDALQSSAAAMAITDTEGLIQYANPAFLALWEAEDPAAVKSRDIRSLWAAPDQAAPLVRAPVNGKTWGGELAAAKINGDVFWVQATAAPNRDAAQKIVGIVYSFIDVTDRKNAEKIIQAGVEANPDVAREKEIFFGHLNILSTSDVIQLIHGTHESGVLHIFSEPEEELGCIAFAEGHTVSASCCDARGDKAVYRLVAAGGHSFRFEPGEPGPNDEGITKSTMGLLLEAARHMDEDISASQGDHAE